MEIDVKLLNYLLSTLGRDRLYSHLDPYKDDLKIHTIHTDLLKPHEGVIDELVESVAREIRSCGYVKYPIVADVRTAVILDGHHRYEVFKRLGLECVPVFLVDYLRSYVDLYPLRKEIPVSKQSVIEMALIRGGVYPPKTTRHIYYGFTIPAVLKPLNSLRKCTDL